MTIRPIAGLREVASVFDGFILDLWGLVHDGEKAYPPSAETLRALQGAGKKTILLSNAPRRGYALIEAMTKMGIGRDLYGEVLSSGEATRDALIRREDPFFAALGRKAYHLGPERDRSVFDDTGIACVGIEDADFIVNTGPAGLDETVEDYIGVLESGAARGLPMVCANPDFVVVRGGRRIVCAGALAQRYEQLGGKVALRGKPDPAVYALALERLGIADRAKVAVVGDALETDVKGGRASGIASIWCTGGIHAEALGVSYGVAADQKKAEDMARREGQMPDYMIPGFYW